MEPDSYPLVFSVLIGNLLWQHYSLKVLNLWLYLHLHGHCPFGSSAHHTWAKDKWLITASHSYPFRIAFPQRLIIRKQWFWTSLVVLWLRLSASNAGIAGLIPGQRTKIPHATGRGKKKKNTHRDFTKLLSYLKSFTASHHHFQEKTQHF